MLPNGFDCERFRPDPSARKRLCHELGLSVGTEVVSLIARYDPLKDHENFTSSFAVLLKQRPGIHAVLVGKNVTKENRDLMNMVLKNGIEDSISLLGERNDLPLIMGASSVVVLSSRAEGFPNVVGEAMACGTPCVVTDVGDARWIVGQTGIVVSPRAPSALAEGILTLLAEKPVERLARGEMARDRILTLFELSSVVARYEKTYMAMIGSEAPCSGVARRIRGAGKKCRVPVEWSR